MLVTRRFLTRAFVALLLLDTAPAAAQALPDARSIIDRYVEAIHGDLLRSQSSMRATGTFELPGMGTTGQLEVAQARPNRMVMTVTLPGLGQIRSGFDGTVGWSVNPMEGPRLLSGKELKQQSDDAAFESALRDASLIDAMETVELTDIDGTACHMVRIAWKSGRETRDCYAVDSGLLIATMARSETVMGPVDATMLYSDYQDFSGVRMPSRTRQRVMSQEFVMTITAVEFGNVSDAVFDPPQEVLVLLKDTATVR